MPCKSFLMRYIYKGREKDTDRWLDIVERAYKWHISLTFVNLGFFSTHKDPPISIRNILAENTNIIHWSNSRKCSKIMEVLMIKKRNWNQLLIMNMTIIYWLLDDTYIKLSWQHWTYNCKSIKKTYFAPAAS